MKVWIKACKKCKGDMTLEQDRYGCYKRCFQCGRTEEIKVPKLGEQNWHTGQSQKSFA